MPLKNRVVAVCGLPRTGSNYFAYTFFLHPRLRFIHNVSHGGTRNLVDAKKADYKMVYEWHKNQDWSITLPLHPSLEDEGIFTSYHEHQNTKLEFDGICFKNDFGENWYKNTLHKLTDRVLCVYCVRTNVGDLWGSWKRWRKADVPSPTDWIGHFRRSVDDAYVLKGQAEQDIIDFEAVTINQPHREIAKRIIDISKKYLGEVGEWQLKFLEKRRLIGDTNKDNFNESDDELMEELKLADSESELSTLISRYTSLIGDTK